MFGDYEAQRHWMEITTSLPALDWYEQTSENDLQYWGLDYPPLTAFHSWLLGKLGHLVDPACFTLHASRGYEGMSCKVFLRISVIVSDLFVYLPGVFVAGWGFGAKDLALRSSTVQLLWLLPPLVLIDHAHFQYNGVCLGLCLAAAGCVARGRTALASVLFTSGLLFKQIALYYAPAFFFGILSICLWRPPVGIFMASQRVVATGLVVLSSASLLLAPWLLSAHPFAAVLQVLHRMFPFARGLYEDKVANFWCSISVVLKVHRLLPAAHVPRLCAAATLLALLPSALCSLRRRAGPGSFAASLFTSSLSFFLFAFQVHEKGILFAATAAALLPMAMPARQVAWAVLAARHFQLVALFSMYPLMVKDVLVVPYALACLALVAFCEMAAYQVPWGSRLLLRASYLVGLLLHSIHAFAPAPARYPDLWTLLITSASCSYFLCALVVVSERSLRTAVGTLGLDLNPAKLFSFLRSPSSQEGVTFQEFDPEAWKKYMSGDYSNLVLPDSREFLDDLPEAAGHMPESVTDRRQGGVEQMRRSMNKDAQDQRKQEHEQMDKFKVGLKSAGGFRQALAHRFGSLLGAWREALDYDGNNRLTFGEFCLALNRLGMHGEVRKLWCQLTKSTDESGFLVFRDLDPQTDTMLSELRKKLTQEYENMLMAWIKGLDTRGTGLVTEKQFVQCCRKIGFGGNARELFKRMQPDAGRTLMTIRDFDTKAFHALSRGDFRMLSEPAQGHHGKSPLELTFHQRNEAGFFYQIRRAADASRRKEFAKACRVAHPSAYSINTIEDFQDLCIRKYGSLIAAWRQCLDEHGNGKRPSPAFVASSRHMGRSDTGEANEGASLRAGKTAVAGQKVGAGLADEEDRASTAVEGAEDDEEDSLLSSMPTPEPPKQRALPLWVPDEVAVVGFPDVSNHWPSSAHQEYLPSTVVFWTEVVKLFTSLVTPPEAFVASPTLGSQSWVKEHFTQAPRELAKAAVPSLVYTFQNNLMFYSLTKLSAPVQQVLYQMKIITTAGLGVLMLGKSLGPVKWSACFLLAFGIMVVQVSRNAQKGDVLDWNWQSLESDQMKGFAAVLKMLQQTQASIWMRNIQLGLFGACSSLLVAVAQDGEVIANRYNIRVLLVIAMNAFGGLLCAVMLKYAGLACVTTAVGTGSEQSSCVRDLLLKRQADLMARSDSVHSIILSSNKKLISLCYVSGQFAKWNRQQAMQRATHGCFSTALSIILTCFMSSLLLQDFTPDLLFMVGTAISVGASLTFGEFCDALRRLGYAGEFRSLFKEYDREQKGYICLADLDPEADVLVSDFLDLLGERFGTLDLAWRDGFHQDPHGSITKKDVMEACAALGYAHDAEKLYGCLQTSPGKQLITIWDIDPACSRSRKRGLEAIIPSAPRPLSPTARGNEAHTFFLEDGSPSSRTRNVMSKTFHTFNSPPLVQQLRRCLRARWGSTVAGWRLSLDPQLHGSCGFGMFMKALEECAFGGKPRALWDELSGEKNSITYMDLDEPAASLLNSFREQLVDRHGSIMDAWHELESAGRGLLDEETFVSVLTEMGITIKHPRKLFKLLLSRQGQRSLAKEGFQALLVGVVPTEQRDLWVSRKPRKESTHKGQASPKRKVSPSKASGATRLGKAGAAPAAPTAVIEEEAKQAPPAELDRSQAQPSRSERNDLKVNVVPPVGKPKAHDVQAAEPESRETAHSVATRAVSSTVSRVAAKLASEEAEQAPRAKVLDSAARKKAIGGLLKAAKTGHLEKSLRQFEEQEATAAAKELPKTLEELRRYLLEKYGSLEAAWRRDFVADGADDAGPSRVWPNAIFDEESSFGGLSELPVIATGRLAKSVQVSPRMQRRSAAMLPEGSCKTTTLRLRNLAGKVLLETQLGSWHVMTLPLKYFICGRRRLSICRCKLVMRIPPDGIELLLIRRSGTDSDEYPYEEGGLMMMYSDEFEDNLLEHIGQPGIRFVLPVNLGSFCKGQSRDGVLKDWHVFCLSVHMVSCRIPTPRATGSEDQPEKGIGQRCRLEAKARGEGRPLLRLPGGVRSPWSTNVEELQADEAPQWLYAC
eukprot:s4048_g5.t2